MKKRGIFLFAILLLVLLFTLQSVSAVFQRACYTASTADGCLSVTSESECESQAGFVKYVQGEDALDLCLESRRCCCYGTAKEPDFFPPEVCAISSGQTNSQITSQAACTLSACTGMPEASYTNCEELNAVGSLCGTAATTDDRRYCCGADNAIFTSAETCRQSLSCQVVQTYSISGNVKDFQINNLNLVTVQAERLGTTYTAETNSLGNYVLTGLMNGVYTVTASKTGYKSISKSATIQNSNMPNLNFQLELLTIEQDSDKDGVFDRDDICPFEPAIQTRTSLGYSPDETSALCNDNIDNDCDGFKDCSDSGCRFLTEYCAAPETRCGDSIVQQPNSLGVFELCDAQYSAAGARTSGEDSACFPKKCTSSCVCEPVCGNNRQDIGEQCDIVNGNSVGCSALSLGCNPSTCTCKPGQICGDHQISGDEQCDFNSNWDGFDVQGNIVSCIWPGQQQACKIDTAGVCGNNVVDSPLEDCDGADDSKCPGFCTSCLCPSTCFESQDKPLISSVAHVSESSDVVVYWESNCIPKSFSVERCLGGSCVTVLESTNDFIFTDKFEKQPNTEYCYSVKAIYADVLGGLKILKSDPVCITIGDRECVKEHASEMCISNVRYGCDETNNKVEIENCDTKSKVGDESFVCLADRNDPDTTNCMFQSNCDECNGILGLFYRIGRTFFNYAANTPCSNVASCYIDYTETSVDKYYSCAIRDIEGKIVDRTCYEYRSKEACESDPCSVTGCEWAENTYSEFGVGVCRPVNESDQDCGKCTGTSSNFKNSVFGACNKETCSLYGACYYTGQDCKHKSEISCRDYVSFEDCTGGTNVSVNVGYNISDQSLVCGSLGKSTPCELNKISGTNQIIQYSSDFFSFGLCKWIKTPDDGYCVKDADNKNNYNGADCREYATTAGFDRRCALDMEPPVTNAVKTPIAGKTYEIEYSVIDNIHLANEIKTYYALGQDSFAYPIYEASAGKMPLFDIVNRSGEYTLYYFSEDNSHNLEQIKSFDLFIDADAPLVDIDFVKDPRVEIINGKDVYVTDLAVTFEARDYFPNSTCSAWLSGLGKDNYMIPKEGEVGVTWQHLYPNLLDANYQLNYWCVDNVGNRIQSSQEIIIDEDKSISNPQPRGAINYNENIRLQVTTAEAADCRYSDEYVSYDVDIPTFNKMNTLSPSAQRTSHSAIIPYISGENTTAHYYVRCLFDDGIIRGTASDDILFAIDKQAPEVFIEQAGLRVDLDDWFNKNVVNLDFKCDDIDILNEGIDMSFGSCNIYYCDTTETCIPQNQGSSSVRKTFNTLEENRYVVRYYSKDSGNNPFEPEIITEYVQMDIKQPTFRISIKDGFDNVREEIGYLDFENKAGFYRLNITTSEPVESIERLWFERADGKTYEFQKEQMARFGNDFWSAALLISGANYDDVETVGTFNIIARDEHGVVGTEIIYGKTFKIDTKAPKSPQIIPDLQTFTTLIDGIYYTDKEDFFVSGLTYEPGLNIEYYLNGELSSKYSQTGEAVKLGEFQGFRGNAGENKIFVMGDVRNTVQQYLQRYLKFTHPRTYPDGGKFYKFESIEFDGTNTIINLDDSLDGSVTIYSEILVYDRDIPTNWFGNSVKLSQPGVNNLTIIAKDSWGNPSEAIEYKIFFDNSAPKAFFAYPNGGWTLNNNMSFLSLQLGELKLGSGFDLASLKINLDNKDFVMEKADSAIEDYNLLQLTGKPEYELAEGEHMLNFSISDYAGNDFIASIDFTIDVLASDVPFLEFEEASKYQNAIFVPSQTGNYRVVFAEPVNEFTTSFGNCITSNNAVYNCTYDAQDSENDVTISAVKEDGNYGQWKYTVVVDTIKPEFTIDYPDRVRSNSTYDIYVNVTNENFDTKSRIIIIDKFSNLPLAAYGIHTKDLMLPDLPDGEYQIIVNVTDQAQNYESVVRTFTVDNSVPEIDILDISADNIYFENVDGENVYYTSSPSIRISGRLVSSDIASIDFINKVYGISKQATLGADRYDVDLLVAGFYPEEITNNINVLVKDRSGNTNEVPLKIISDLRPPGTPQFLVSEI